MLDKPICITDIETTGGSARNSVIIEIAVIKISGGTVVEEFSTLINPARSIPGQITALTSIKNKDVENAPYFEDIAERLSALYEGSYFMAHSVLFDFSFIKRQLESLGYVFKPRLLCSVKLSRSLYPEVKGHSLEKIIQRFGISARDRHRALDDAMAVHEFMNIAAGQLGIDAVENMLKKQLKLKTLPSNFDEKYLEGVDNTPGVYIFKDSSGTAVYIGKSVSLRNRILSHFNQSSKIDNEMKISQSTHSLEVIKTGSELEALLLESKLVKEQLPLFNRKLRRKKVQTILKRHKTDAGYDTIKLLEADVSNHDKPEEIYGIFDTRRKAKAALLAARDEYGLCSKLIGVEKTQSSCFYYHLKKCRGACINEENVDLYNLRFSEAFKKSRIQSWKHGGPVVLKLSDTKGLLVDHWIVKGIVNIDDSSEPEVEPVESSFDMDTYKILNSYMRSHKDGIFRLQSIKI